MCWCWYWRILFCIYHLKLLFGLCLIHFTFYINYAICYHDLSVIHLQFWFTFLKFWILILEQFTDEWIWNYIAWCTTVDLTFHNTSTFSSSIMYVDSLQDDSSEYSSRCNWVVAFCFQNFTKWFFFPHFPDLSPHAWQSSGDLHFPFLQQYPHDAFLFPPLLDSCRPWLSLFLSESYVWSAHGW